MKFFTTNISKSLIVISCWLPCFLYGKNPAIPWSNRPITEVKAFGQDFAEFMEAFMVRNRFKVKLSEQALEIGGVNAAYSGTPEKIFEQVLEKFGLQSYYDIDRNIVYVYDASEAQNALIEIEEAALSDLYEILSELKIPPQLISWRYLKSQNLLFLVGPPQALVTVKELAEKIGGKKKQDGRRGQRVFRLQYAEATDTKIRIQNREITNPGMATLLREHLTGTPPQQRRTDFILGREPRGFTSNAVSLFGPRPASIGQVGAGQGFFPETDISDLGAGASRYREGAPEYVVNADSRANAVIVSGPEGEFEWIEDLIRELDQPGQQIQIQALIVDVKTDFNLDWGTENRLTYNRPGFARSTLIEAITSGAGMNISTLVTGSFVEVFNQIKALEARGYARIVNKGSILASENRESIIAKETIANVPLAGAVTVDLFPVSASLFLRVLPRVVYEGYQPKVYMSVNIEDGNFVKIGEAEEFLTSDTNFLDSRMKVDEGQILLIGGQAQSTETRNDNGVPVIQHIPILGHAFKDKTVAQSEYRRLFLISPTILGSGSPEHEHHLLEAPPLEIGPQRSVDIHPKTTPEPTCLPSRSASYEKEVMVIKVEPVHPSRPPERGRYPVQAEEHRHRSRILYPDFY